MMELQSRSKKVYGLLAVVLLLVGVYGVFVLVSGKTNPFSEDLVLWQDVEIPAETRLLIEQRIDVATSAIKAYEGIDEEVPLGLVEAVARDAYLLGNLELAREYYAVYLDRNPVSHVAWSNYGKVLGYMGDYAPAESALRQAISLSPSEETYRDLLFYLNRQEGREQDVKEELEKLVEIVGQTKFNMIMLSEWHFEQDDCEKGLEYLSVAITLDPNDDVLQQDYENAQMSCRK